MTSTEAASQVPDDWEIEISIQPDMVQYSAIAPDDERFNFRTLEEAVTFARHAFLRTP